jgi:hypothetical protein
MSPHRDHQSEGFIRMMSGDLMLPSSLRKRVGNGGGGGSIYHNQQSNHKTSSWTPESEEKDDEMPRIPRLCMMENKDDPSMEEAKYDTEMLIVKSMTVSNKMKKVEVNKWLKKHAIEKT